MKILNYLLLFLTLLFLNFCNHTTKSKVIERNKKKLAIDLEGSKTVQMSDIFQNIQYLKLENKKEQLIGKVRKILIRDSKIFIFEKNTPSIFIYGFSGKFINQIKITKGRGPQEMLYARDFTVNTQLNEIIVLGFQEIHKYSYKGEFLDRISIKIDPDKITLLPGSGYALFMNNSTYSSGEIENTGFNLLYFDEEKVFRRFLKIEKYKSGLGFGVTNNFPRYNGKQLLYFHPSYNIYELKKDKIAVRYTLDFGPYNVPESLFRERKNLKKGYKFIEKTINREYASYISRFLETDHLIYFSIFWDRQKSYPVFYLKKKDKSVVAKKLVNDIDNGLTPYFKAKYKNELVTEIQPSDLLKKAKAIKKMPESKRNKHEKELLEFAKNLDPLDNPVLMFAQIKTKFTD
ncbi:6-bladed beta-propeller protein [Fodinibius salinus]|uniref:6-bladed beta-propeller protein n=1 Tax=Fodinibius salinus TaxID=860790 RepID=A0A5D3YIM1_9BACT|nr:6-bladed beta-propeller [Fodinibius salinus]TYP93633.1 6-bladed beta-propeller protein [Fodinibius salinus]